MRSFDGESMGRLRGILGERPADYIAPGEFRPAAVLVALVERGGTWSVVLSRRSDELPVHSGQISFPGGALENGELPEDAAIREAGEEVGIDRDRIKQGDPAHATGQDVEAADGHGTWAEPSLDLYMRALRRR